MKVTGWTYWGDESYIDILHDNVRRMSRLTENVIKLPDIDTARKMSTEELNALLAERTRQMDAALDCSEVNNAKELAQKIYNVVVEDVRNNNYHFTGFAHQGGCGTPIIDDKYILCLSTRSWGDLMAQAFPDEIDDSDGLGYLDWAWDIPEGQENKVKIPEVES